mmetsp:Transcript_26938/g.53043  ORF Transcript_26938/g.53043 Transcript_26938/m.53043 type:complete len:129 (-) Transcript_26938:206-592(-)
MDYPTYQDICTGETGHAEAVQVIFDPSKVSYHELLKVFWRIHDPTTLNRQKNDRGTQYRSGIYFHSQDQQHAAQKSIDEHQPLFAKPIVTELAPAAKWWRAEQYHQQYLENGGQSAAKGCRTPIRCYG